MTRPIECPRAAAPRGAAHGGLAPASLLLAAVLVFQLFYLGSQPFAAGLFLPPWDKVAHLVVLTAIGALPRLARAFRGTLLVNPAGTVIGARIGVPQERLPGM